MRYDIVLIYCYLVSTRWQYQIFCDTMSIDIETSGTKYPVT